MGNGHKPVITLKSQFSLFQVVKDLSTDAKYMYRMCIAIVDKKFDGVEKEAIGALCMARWLTLGGRTLRLFISIEALDISEYMKEALTRLATYIISVYYKVNKYYVT